MRESICLLQQHVRVRWRIRIEKLRSVEPLVESLRNGSTFFIQPGLSSVELFEN
jgi:hypothetical protein